MAGTHAPTHDVDVLTASVSSPPSDATPRRAGRAAGHLVAAGVDLVLLWITHQLLDWGWPRFLTDAFEDLLPIITVSLVASAVAELIFVIHDGGRFRPFADLVTAAISLVVAWRTWQVYPFDFSSYAHDWSWLATTVVWVGIVGTAVTVVVNAVRLAGRLVDPGRC